MTFIPHVKIVFRGTYNTTQEEWTFSTKWQKDYGGFALDINNIDATAVQTALATLFTTNQRFSQYVRVTGWRAYDIGPSGRMVGNPRIVEFAPAAYIAGTSTYLVPPQIALCVTTGGANRGPARYGRFYLPAPGKSVTGDCRISATDQSDYLTGAKAFLEAVQNAIDIPDTFTPAKMINASAVGAGAEQEVTHIRIGRVLDTQRRRRAQLDEAYAETTVDVTT